MEQTSRTWQLLSCLLKSSWILSKQSKNLNKILLCSRIYAILNFNLKIAYLISLSFLKYSQNNFIVEKFQNVLATIFGLPQNFYLIKLMYYTFADALEGCNIISSISNVANVPLKVLFKIIEMRSYKL